MPSKVKVVNRNAADASEADSSYSDINQILNTFATIANDNETHSVINKAFKNITKSHPELSTSYYNNFYSAVFNTLGGNKQQSNISLVPTDKVSRLQEYERMAANAEISACLEEIASSAINFNERKQCVEISFNDIEYASSLIDNPEAKSEYDSKKDTLYKEFYKFVYPLKLKTKLYRYVKHFLKTGEVCWENIIDPSNPSLGIIDFAFLPSHSYDFAYNTETKEKVGLWVKVLSTKTGDTLNYSVDTYSLPQFGNYTSTFSGNSYNLGSFNRFDDYSRGDLMFLPFEQVTYVESGEHSPNDLIVYPLIERVRRTYNQLACIEDAIIIYRLARAPTRLVFNVGVGMANNSKGAQQVQQLIRRYNVAKTYNPATGTISNTRDPHTMTESFWFIKSANGEGTDVTELSSNIDMGDLPDLRYFQKKLWAALHVPAKRFTDASDYLNRNPANDMTAEEYKFCKFIIQILLNFSEAIKETFITHLKLTGLYESLNLNEAFFDIHFVNPLSYELYEQGRILTQRLEMYKSLVSDSDSQFSKTLAMKKYLNYTPEEIEENWLEYEKEVLRQKLIESRTDAIVESEIELFNEQLAAEREAKRTERENAISYDTTRDITIDNITGEKSDEVLEKGVEQMADRAQESNSFAAGRDNSEFSFDAEEEEYTTDDVGLSSEGEIEDI